MRRMGGRHSVLVSGLLAGLIGLLVAGTSYAKTQSFHGHTLEEWVARLSPPQRSPEPDRVLAVLALGKFGPRAVPHLAQALARDPSPRVREEAARALRRTRESMARALPALNRALSDPSPGVRRAAAVTMAREGVGVRLPEGDLSEPESFIVRARPEDAPALQVALADQDPRIRSAAIHTLGRIGPAARPAASDLALALQDPAASVRDAASDALRQLGPEVVPTLVEALKSHKTQVRQAAVWALGVIGPAAEKAAPELRALSAHDPSPHVSRAAEVALNRIQPR